MRCRWKRTFAVLSCLLWTAVARLPAQQEAGPLPGVFSEVLDVRVVNLEVLVTDKDGVPVRGLKPADFILQVDGEEVPIDYFSEIRNGVAVLREEDTEATAVAELPAVVPGDPVETSYLVFIDEFFGIARDRDKVVRSLIADLPRLGPGDRMAVVAFNGSELDMLTSWSQSIPALERALESALERPTYGLRRYAEERQFDYDQFLRASFESRLGRIDADAFYRNSLDPDERYYLERLTEQVQRSVTAAASALRSFAMPPGRKVMLIYSGGWPFFPVSFVGSNVSPLVVASEGESGVGLFRPLTDAANLLGYTLYPVDMPGFSDLLSDVPSSGVGRGVGGLPGTTDVGVPRSSFLRQQEVQYTLQFLAQETGGRAFINAERLRAFDATVSDTRSFYWLGFTPQRDWDDRRHKVEILLREPSFRLRSRSGYLDSSHQHEVAMALESTLLFGHPAGSGSLGLEVGSPKALGRRRMEVPISVLIPLSEVTVLPDGNGHIAQLELRVAVRDERGRRADIPVIPVVVRTESTPGDGTVGRYDTALKLRRLHHDAVIAVYDPASGRILSASTEFTP